MNELGYTLGYLYHISGPAGSGKSTLVKKLIEGDEGRSSPYLRYTTRTIRPWEKDGVDEHFIDDSTFDKMLAQLTAQKIKYFTFERSNGRYLIIADEIHSALNSGKDIFLQNAQNYDLLNRMKEYFGDRLVTIFIHASPPVIKKRIVKKPKEDREEPLNIRKKRYEEGKTQIIDFDAKEEIRNLYDYVVYNDGAIEEGLAELTEFIQNHRTKHLKYSNG